MRLSREAPRKARMEIVPLIDVMFLVLASFVYATVSMTAHRGLTVDLPRATAARLEEKDHVMVTVTAAGEVYLDREAVPIDRLGERLLTIALTRPDVEVRVNGDERAPHGVVVQVLDAARRAGLRKVDIEARR